MDENAYYLWVPVMNYDANNLEKMQWQKHIYTRVNRSTTTLFMWQYIYHIHSIASYACNTCIKVRIHIRKLNLYVMNMLLEYEIAQLRLCTIHCVLVENISTIFHACIQAIHPMPVIHPWVSEKTLYPIIQVDFGLKIQIQTQDYGYSKLT